MRDIIEDEEQRDALLFGQENPFEDEEKTPVDSTKKPSDPSSRMAMIAIAVATVLLTLMVVYRPDSIDERVNTLNQLLRIGTGDSKMASVLPPTTLPQSQRPDSIDEHTGDSKMTTSSTPLMTQSGMLPPPLPKSTSASTGSNVMSSSYNNQAAIAISATNPMQAGTIPSHF